MSSSFSSPLLGSCLQKFCLMEGLRYSKLLLKYKLSFSQDLQVGQSRVFKQKLA